MIFSTNLFLVSLMALMKILSKEYREAICLAPKVKGVKLVRGRSYGSNIFLDVVVEMSPDLSVYRKS
jgi:divalent metal cation (Fe/Co/Zn/Cd) transporter